MSGGEFCHLADPTHPTHQAHRARNSHLGWSIVVHNLHPRVGADREDSAPCTTLSWMKTVSPVWRQTDTKVQELQQEHKQVVGAMLAHLEVEKIHACQGHQTCSMVKKRDGVVPSACIRCVSPSVQDASVCVVDTE